MISARKTGQGPRFAWFDSLCFTDRPMPVSLLFSERTLETVLDSPALTSLQAVAHDVDAAKLKDGTVPTAGLK
jgi:hypothetical protein